jgi:hypothetical protein
MDNEYERDGYWAAQGEWYDRSKRVFHDNAGQVWDRENMRGWYIHSDGTVSRIPHRVSTIPVDLNMDYSQGWVRSEDRGDNMGKNLVTYNYEPTPGGAFQTRSDERFTRGAFVYTDEASKLVRWLVVYMNGNPDAVKPILQSAENTAVEDMRTVVKTSDLMSGLQKLVGDVHAIVTEWQEVELSRNDPVDEDA